MSSKLLGAVARGMAETGLKNDYEVAARIGMSRQTYSRLKAQGFRGMRVEDFGTLVDALGMEDVRLGDIFGGGE